MATLSARIKALAQAVAVDIKAIKASLASLGTASTRNVGAADGDLPLSIDVYKAAFTRKDEYYNSSSADDPATIKNADDFEVGTRHLVHHTHLNMPPISDFYFIETLYNYSVTTKLQKAWGYSNTSMFIRSLNGRGEWSPWRETVFNGTSPDFASIKVGTGAPIMAFTKVTATTPASGAGDTVQLMLAHGLVAGKILSCQGFINNGATRTPIPTQSGGVSYSYVIDGANISVTLTNTDTAALHGKTVTFFITYEV